MSPFELAGAKWRDGRWDPEKYPDGPPNDVMAAYDRRGLLRAVAEAETQIADLKEVCLSLETALRDCQEPASPLLP